MSAIATVQTWGRMVKFSHSVFALPFGLAGAVLAAAASGITWPQVMWIVVAMVGARNAAMGFNRLVDQDYDARNPRTAERELPRGRLGRPAVWAFTLALAGLFVFASFMLSRLCGFLSLVVLVVLFGYSYAKRFTWASHLVLGLSLGLAPIGGWVAIDGGLSAVPLLLGAAVLLWVAGFDVVYACQDVEFDREAGLFSIPARFGVERSLLAARGLHAAALATLAAVGWIGALHPVYWIGWGAIGLLLTWEHRLVRPGDLSKLGMAFFNLNGIVSVLYLATVLIAVLMEART